MYKTKQSPDYIILISRSIHNHKFIWKSGKASGKQEKQNTLISYHPCNFHFSYTSQTLANIHSVVGKELEKAQWDNCHCFAILPWSWHYHQCYQNSINWWLKLQSSFMNFTAWIILFLRANMISPIVLSLQKMSFQNSGSFYSPLSQSPRGARYQDEDLHQPSEW